MNETPPVPGVVSLRPHDFTPPYQRISICRGDSGSLGFLLFGVFAMVDPARFYESMAMFEPYNAHFIRDLGAFQIGLGAILAMAAFLTSDALAAGLVGAGLGASAHVVSHLSSLEAGGNPALDIPALSILGLLLLIAGAMRWRRIR